MKNVILICYVIFFAMSNVFSQVSDTIWTKVFGGPGYDEGSSVQQTSDGGYVICGSTGSYGAGSNDLWLIKTDENGDTLWTKTYGGEASERGSYVQQTSDEGYIICGSTFSYGAGSYDLWLIKTDENGDTVWTKVYGGEGYDAGCSVQQTADLGYIIAGYTNSFGAGVFDVWLIKTDLSGDTLWTKVYGGAGYDWGYSVQQTSDDGYVICGSTDSFGAGYNSLWLIKTDENGDSLWTKTYGGEQWDAGSFVQQTSDGRYIISGSTGSYGAGSDDIWLIRTDEIGDTLWTKTYGGEASERGSYVQQTSDGGYVICGSTGSYGAGSDDLWLIKTDENGDTLWTRTFGGEAGDGGSSVQQTFDRGYVICGSTKSFGRGMADMWLIKTDSSGHTTALPKSAGPVTIDIGTVHNYVSSNTIVSSTGEDIQTFLIGRADLSESSMLWLEGGYSQNHYLYYGSFRIGYNNDYIRFSNLTCDDWATYRNDPTQVSPFDVHFSMTDSLADNLKVGVRCLCKVHAWSEPDRDDFLIYEYFIVNISPGLLTDVYAGLHVDGDISSVAGGSGALAYYLDDMMDYYLDTDVNGHPESISYMYDGDNPNISGDDTGGKLIPKESLGFLGSRVLDCPPSKTGTPANQQSGHQWWDWNHDPQAGTDWYHLMSLEQFKEDTTVFHDYRYFQTMGPWDINAGDTIRIALAFGLGEGLSGLRENLQTAYDLYWSEIRTPLAIGLNDTYLPSKFELNQNYPNPFNPLTVISYQLPVNIKVELSIYNILGQKVATLVDAHQKTGYHQVEWDASGLASGLYYYRIEAGTFVQTRKMVYLK